MFQIRERVLSKVRSGKKDVCLEDIVHSFSVPDVRYRMLLTAWRAINYYLLLIALWGKCSTYRCVYDVDIIIAQFWTIHSFHSVYSSVGKVLGDVFSPRRPLNPVRNIRKKPKRLNANVLSAQILVRVVRALNVPIRTTQQSPGYGSYSVLYSLCNVCCDSLFSIISQMIKYVKTSTPWK